MNHARPHEWQKERKMQKEWRSFQGGAWETEVNVRDFIQRNYHPYDGNESFCVL